MTTPPKTRTKAAKKTSGGVRGNMKSAEITPLVMAARKAFDRQSEAGLIDDGENFNAWRHRQCIAAVGKPGLTACNHGDYKPLMAHFKTLYGDDAGAFRDLMKTGTASDHADPDDTHEDRRNLSRQIAQMLASHMSQGGRLGVGYIVTLARGKTRRPDLTLGRDWQAGLADRCTVDQLTQIRDTLNNRISAVEGRGDIATRNKSQRRRVLASDPDEPF